MSSPVREPGARPAAGTVPLCVPEIRGREWDYVKECLDTGWVSSVGAFVNRFERAMADAVGVPFAVATTSGTAALHVSLQVAGVGTDDEVVVSGLTFVAPVNTIRYLGAWPVFADADPVTWQMDVPQVVTFLETGCDVVDGRVINRATGRRVAAVVPVHILGHPVDLDPLLAVCRRLGIPVIEDATESLGAWYRERPVGSMGLASCLSFNGNKLLTTGGGGMVCSADQAFADRIRYLTTQAKVDPIEYVHEAVGYNYRLTNVQAAIGVAQAEQLAEFLAGKRRIAERYCAALRDIPWITLPVEAPWALSAWWLFTVLVGEGAPGTSRDLMAYLKTQGVESRPFWCPMHRLRPFAGAPVLGHAGVDRLYAQGLSLPCSVGLTEAEQTHVIEAIRGWQVTR